MKARLLLQERHQIGERAFVALKIWSVPNPVTGSAHDFKYSFAYVVEGRCVLRYDNEAGKGDHRHVGDREESLKFESPEALLAAFWADVDTWRPE